MSEQDEIRVTRRSILRTLAGAAVAACASPGRRPAGAFADDFDVMWSACRDAYCFFPDKATDWDRVRAIYRPLAIATTSVEALVNVLDDSLAELYDPHCHVQGQRDGARRWIPFDLWVEWRDGRAIVTNVRSDSMASRAGVLPGDEIQSLDGRPIGDAARDVAPRSLAHADPEAEAFSLLAALTGIRGTKRTLRLRSATGEVRDAALIPDAHPAPAPASTPDVTWSRQGEFGVIRIATFGEASIVDLFDHALTELKDTKGLILDVRENGGGDTAYARPMMGRFIRNRTQYAWMARRAPGSPALGERWGEYVDARGPFTYERPVAVLVDRFSASMAEGFPMGMRAIANASIVGTKMAGLGAAIRSERLPRSGLSFQFSAEPVYDIHGAPRSALVPDVVVKLEDQPSKPGEDRILALGLQTLAARS